jgi:hypothetical protein
VLLREYKIMVLDLDIQTQHHLLANLYHHLLIHLEPLLYKLLEFLDQN